MFYGAGGAFASTYNRKHCVNCYIRDIGHRFGHPSSSSPQAFDPKRNIACASLPLCPVSLNSHSTGHKSLL
jgi:hypothetical protein